MQWRIGEVTVTKVVELEVTGGSRFILPQATREAVQPIGWLVPHFADADGRLRMSIHSFVVQTPSRRIVVDTCLGNDKQAGAFRPGTICTGRSCKIWRRPGSRARPSTTCFAPICTWITWAGTQCW